MNGHGKVSKARKRWEQENQCLSVTTSVTCDNTTGGRGKKNKIPTAAPEPSFLTKFLAVHHLSVFSAEDTTGGGGENDGGD